MPKGVYERTEKSINAYKHGMSFSPEYLAWASMKNRCYNKNNPKYHLWGGRNITVCDRWRNSFQNFYLDMGLKPTPKKHYSIERINNYGNYEPNNCKWATQKEQQNNRRNNK